MFITGIGSTSSANSDEDDICQLCQGSEDDMHWIACDKCDGWYHFGCVGLTSAPDQEETWICDNCCAE